MRSFDHSHLASILLVFLLIACSSCERSDEPVSYEIEALAKNATELRYGSEGHRIPGEWSASDAETINWFRRVVEAAEKETTGAGCDAELGTIWFLQVVDGTGSAREIRTSPGGVWYYCDASLGQFVKLTSTELVEFKLALLDRIEAEPDAD